LSIADCRLSIAMAPKAVSATQRDRRDAGATLQPARRAP
jgi:hypothetical protein